MEFFCSQICCGGGDWAIVGKFSATHCDVHSMGFFILGSDVSDKTSVENLSVLRNLVSLNEKKHVCSLDISNSLE